MPAGRPTDYTPELADLICADLSNGLSLRAVCKADDRPSAASVFTWMRKYPEFLEQYTRAKQESTLPHFEDITAIADEDPLEPVLDKEGMPVIVDGKVLRAANKASIDHARLRIESRKWVLSKIIPKLYGDKQHIEHSAPEGVTFNMTYTSPEKK